MKARTVRCSFCGKSRSEVSDIVASAPHAAKAQGQNKSSTICNECVRRFNQFLTSNQANDTLVSAANLK